MVARFNRRKLIATAAAFAGAPYFAFGDDYVDLEWADLVPVGETIVPPMLSGLVDHSETSLTSQQPQSSGVRSDWNGKIVRLPGFIVPIDFTSAGVTAFILVPFVGACVHVPPPPANQLVFVTTQAPYDSAGMYAPVHVVGKFGASSISTHLADVGYGLAADHIRPFKA